MRAFKVQINGRNICTAGLGDLGVLTAILSWVKRESEADEEFHLGVGGLRNPEGDHANWKCPPVQVGDQIVLRIIETTRVTKPATIKSVKTSKAESDRFEKKQLRRMAKKFGWTIVTNQGKKKKK